MCRKKESDVDETLFDPNGKRLTEKEVKELKEIRKIQRRISALKNCEFICAAVLLLCIFISLTVVVIFQIDNDLANYKDAAEVVSTYTSIILGFVAMTVSLIGMVLSFHNTKQAEESSLSTTKEFLNLSYSVGNLNELEKRLEDNLVKVSDKIDILDKQMQEFKQLEMQLTRIQDNINRIADELQVNIDQRKGSETFGVQNLKVTPEQVSNGLISDEQ